MFDEQQGNDRAPRQEMPDDDEITSDEREDEDQVPLKFMSDEDGIPSEEEEGVENILPNFTFPKSGICLFESTRAIILPQGLNFCLSRG